MQIDDKLLTREEKALFTLRALFDSQGYTRYAMSRFEPYDLYVENKDFLGNDRIITFTDVGGKLKALKPDVTLSIVKRAPDIKGEKSQVYYSENVYRARPGAGGFREILQAGVECIGDLNAQDVCSVVLLAVQALKALSDEYVLTLSHAGLITSIMDFYRVPTHLRDSLLRFVREKNAEGLDAFCRVQGISAKSAGMLSHLITLYGPLRDCLPALRELSGTDAMKNAARELQEVADALENLGEGERVRLDFSVMNNMLYYDGMVFKGFVQGLPEGILSGGQYGGLLQKMGRQANAIGFAVYLNEVEYLP